MIRKRGTQDIAEKWSLTPDDRRRLFKPGYNVTYRVVRFLTFFGAILVGIVGFGGFLGLVPAMRGPGVVWAGLCGVGLAMGGFLVLLICFPRTLAHMRVLDAALRTQSPAMGLSADDVARRLDAKAVAQAARQTRMAGLLALGVIAVMALSGLPQLIALWGHRG